MDPIASFPLDVREKLLSIVIEAISHAQQQITDYKQGIYYVDFKRSVAPLIQPLIEEGHQINHIIMEALLVNTFTNDMFYSNEDFSQFSVVELEGLFKWSYIVKDKFKGYNFVQDKKIFEAAEAQKLSFDKMLEIYLSKEFKEDQVMENLKEEYDKYGPAFLDGKQVVSKVVYASFMRSGSTLMRKYLETVTGIITGSIYPNIFTMNFSLMASGFKGEAYLDDQVWIFKAHHPFLFSQISNPLINKALVCIRNPLDVIVSFMQLRLTQTHTKSCSNQFHLDNPKVWNDYILDMSRLWNDYNAYWHQVAQNNVVPVYFFRFEDLITNPKVVLTEVFEFLLGVPSINDTLIQQRIEAILKEGEKSNTLYKPRQGGINKNQDMFTDDQLLYIKEQCKKYIKYFGYGGIQSGFDFFQYESSDEEVKQSQDIPFKEDNRAQIKWCSEKKEEIGKTNIPLNSLYENAPQLGSFQGPELRAELLKLQEKSTLKY